MITFSCDKCGKALRVSDRLAGRVAYCPACGKAKLDDWPPGADDWPPGAVGPLLVLDDEQSLEYFNRYVAGDR
jgi:hypothetical protein